MLQFLPMAARAIYGARKPVAKGIGKLYNKYYGKQSTIKQGPLNKSQVSMDAMGPMTRGTRFQRYGGGLGDLGMGGAEFAYGIDTFDDPEADLFDKAVGTALGLGGFGMMRRGARRTLTSARGGGRGAQDAILNERRPLASLGQTKYALPLTGLQIGKEMVTDEDPTKIQPVAFSQEAQDLIKRTNYNDEQNKLIDQFTKIAPGGDLNNLSGEEQNRLGEELVRLGNDKQNNKVEVVKDDGQTTLVDVNKQVSQAQAARAAQPNNKVTIQDEGDPIQGIDQAKRAVPSVLSSTANPSGSKGGDLNYSKYGGAVGDLFDKLHIKESDYARSDAAIKEYQEMIKGQRSKVKSFEDYKKAFTEYTGDDQDQSKNIALFKWAMNMMTGTTSQGGFAGLLDVAGKAGVEAADDLQAINAQEKAENRDLAVRYMQYEENVNSSFDALEREAFQLNIGQIRNLENARITDMQDFRSKLIDYETKKMEVFAAATKAEKDANKLKAIDYVSIPGNTATGRNILKVGRTEDGRALVQKYNEETGKLGFVEPTNEEAKSLLNAPPVEQSPKGRRTAMERMQSTSQGIAMVDEVLQISQNIKLGAPAVGTKFTKQLGAVSNDLFSMFSSSSDIPGTKADYQADDFGGVFTKTVAAQYGDDQEGYNDIIKTFNKDKEQLNQNIIDLNDTNSKVFKKYKKKMGGSDKSDAEISRDIATLLIIENRMKYIIANSNKGEERLTQNDIDAAAATTDIFSILGGSTEIFERYKVLRGELNKKFEAGSQLYQESGGSADIVHGFKNTDLVKKWMAKNQGNENQTPKTEKELQDLKNRAESELLQFFSKGPG